MPFQGTLIHDTVVIVDADAGALSLFRCDRDDLIDRSIYDILADDESKQLAKFRVAALREHGRLGKQQYAFLRFDETSFWGEIETRHRTDGRFDAIITYLSEW